MRANPLSIKDLHLKAQAKVQTFPDDTIHIASHLFPLSFFPFLSHGLWQEDLMKTQPAVLLSALKMEHIPCQSREEKRACASSKVVIRLKRNTEGWSGSSSQLIIHGCFAPPFCSSFAKLTCTISSSPLWVAQFAMLPILDRNPLSTRSPHYPLNKSPPHYLLPLSWGSNEKSNLC